jgi:hypothetical protein
MWAFAETKTRLGQGARPPSTGPAEVAAVNDPTGSARVPPQARMGHGIPKAPVRLQPKFLLVRSTGSTNYSHSQGELILSRKPHYGSLAT